MAKEQETRESIEKKAEQEARVAALRYLTKVFSGFVKSDTETMLTALEITRIRCAVEAPF